jgi:uncharacterized protein (DUF2147 family)
MQIFPKLVRSRGGNLTAGATLVFGAVLAVLDHRPAAAQVPEVGVWINHEGKGAVEIKPCGAALCGNIVWLRDPVNDQGQPLFDRRNPQESKRNRPICGLPVIGNVKRTSEGWDEGWIYNPEEGAQYDVALQASGDRLTVTGYKGIKLFSKTLIWTRAPADLQRCEGAKQTKAKSVAPVKAATTPTPEGGAAKPAAKSAVAPAQGKPPAAQKATAAPTAKPAAKPAAKDAAKSPSATAPKAANAKVPSPKPVARPSQAATAKPGIAEADKKAPVKKSAAVPGTATPAAKATAAKPVAKKKTAEEAEASSAVE